LGEQLTEQQIHAISLTLCGWRAVAVADELGISPQTLSRWKANPTYKATLNDNKMRILSAAREKLQVSAEKAVRELVAIATEDESAETRRKACMNVIQLVGLSDPAKGLYGWGIGATTEQGVIEEELRDQYIRELSTPDYILRYREEKAKESKNSS